MRVTTKSRYGLRAMIQLGIDTTDEKRTTLSSIAEKQCLSERYLEQIFSLLKKDKLITSTRGVKGGYSLARAPEEITVKDILKALESPVEIVACLKKGSCDKEDECISYDIWKKIFDCMIDCASNINLKDIIDETMQKREGIDGKANIFGPCCNNENKK